MKKEYILAIDQSTQGTKGILFSATGNLVARSDLLHKQMVDDLGWVEHDPQEIIDNVEQVVRDVVEKADIAKSSIVGVGISNQRETVMAWERKSGKPVYPAIVWQCARAEKICERVRQDGWAMKIRKATGLQLSPYFSAAKLAWIMENVTGVKELAQNGNLCCGTMDSWLIYCLTGGQVFKTDYSNASRTQLFNIQDLCWDEEICEIFGVPSACLPEVCDSNDLFGMTDFSGYLEEKIPIHAALGDSHAALFGQGCVYEGGIKATYGTGSSVMLNTGKKIIMSQKGLVTSLAWSMDGDVNYVLEGNINYTGAVISWLKDDLQLITAPAETEKLAREANPSDKTYLVPAFTGLGAPYWDSDARGLFTGMSRVTGKKELVRAALDSIVYQISDIVRLMQKESGLHLERLRADGGPTKNRYLMEFQSNILAMPVEIPEMEELSACGAAYAAGLALGFYTRKVLQQAAGIRLLPQMPEDERARYYAGWRGAIRQAVHYHAD